MSGVCRPSGMACLLFWGLQHSSRFPIVLWAKNVRSCHRPTRLPLSLTVPNRTALLNPPKSQRLLSFLLIFQEDPATRLPMGYFHVVSLVWILIHEYILPTWPQAQCENEGTGSALARNPNTDSFLASPLLPTPSSLYLELIWVLGG